ALVRYLGPDLLDGACDRVLGKVAQRRIVERSQFDDVGQHGQTVASVARRCKATSPRDKARRRTYIPPANEGVRKWLSMSNCSCVCRIILGRWCATARPGPSC